MRVAVIGVGFMGGSFLLALKDVFKEIYAFGVDINPSAIEKAKAKGVLDEGSVELSALKEFEPELVVLASPVRTFEKIALALKGLLPESCVITDLGSVKGNLVFKLEKLLGNRFVGGHPIAGTEKSGVEFSFGELFKNKKVVLTPTDTTDREALSLVKETWEAIGSKVEFMEPYLHDYVFGAVSHLPHAVAFALIDALIDMSEDRKVNLFLYPGAGFRDFTRIAASDPVMWKDIFLENKNNVLLAIEHYVNSLEKLKKFVQDENEKDMLEFLKEVKDKRLKLEEG